MSRPSMTTLPSEFVSMPPKMLSTVDLPAPDAPRMMASSPFSMPKLTSSFAVMVVEPIW
jgi:hypothetical protein